MKIEVKEASDGPHKLSELEPGRAILSKGGQLFVPAKTLFRRQPSTIVFRMQVADCPIAVDSDAHIDDYCHGTLVRITKIEVERV